MTAENPNPNACVVCLGKGKVDDPNSSDGETKPCPMCELDEDEE